MTRWRPLTELPRLGERVLLWSGSWMGVGFLYRDHVTGLPVLRCDGEPARRVWPDDHPDWLWMLAPEPPGAPLRARQCSDCRYATTPADEEPCRSCGAHCGAWEWRP